MPPQSNQPKVISGDAHPSLTAEIARCLGVSPEPVEVSTFADGERKVYLASDLRGSPVFVVQPLAPSVNDQLMSLLLLVDAAKAAGAASVTAVVPYLGYARQERRGRSGEPRSAQVVARLFEAVGVDHLITVDLHAPALESAFSMPVTALAAAEVFLPHVAGRVQADRVVVTPDAGGLKRAQHYAKRLDAELAVVVKERRGADRTAVLRILGEVRGKHSIVVDDLVSSAATLVGAAEALKAAGAASIGAVFTHAVLASGARDRLLAAPFEFLLTTDSVPREATSRIETVSLAPMLARSIEELSGE